PPGRAHQVDVPEALFVGAVARGEGVEQRALGAAHACLVARRLGVAGAVADAGMPGEGGVDLVLAEAGEDRVGGLEHPRRGAVGPAGEHAAHPAGRGAARAQRRLGPRLVERVESRRGLSGLAPHRSSPHRSRIGEPWPARQPSGQDHLRRVGTARGWHGCFRMDTHRQPRRVSVTAMSAVVVGIVLAAGAGTRYGRPKALAEGGAWLRAAIEALRGGGCDRVVVVLGATGPHHAGLGIPADVTTVWAADWARGLSASLRAGLRAAERVGGRYAAIMPVDTPDVGAAVVTR